MRPRICGVITGKDPNAVEQAEPFVDLFEVRIDLIGEGWPELARGLNKPWIGCNRLRAEGGRWRGSEADRTEQLLRASELGADIIDIELGTENLEGLIPQVKKRSRCLLSFHDFRGTPSPDKMREIVERQQRTGADICKVVTTAQKSEDNLAVLQLITGFPGVAVVAFAMGDLGLTSRMLCPLVGGHFTYASLGRGKESAPGQITAGELWKIYGMVAEWKA
ncbi:MAG: type I 3-dehydroquinate dehydratase [Chloroflexota bacterium]